MKRLFTIGMVIAAVFMAALCVQSLVFGECGGTLECTTGAVPMKCHWAYRASAGLGGLGFILSLAALFLRSTEGRRFSAISLICIAILAVLMLYPLIGVCANETMSCVSHRPISAAFSLLAIVGACIGLAGSNVEKEALPSMRI